MWRRDERGQVVVEYAIVFPIQLLLTLSIIQFAHIFVAKNIIGYAAFCGARSAMVGESAEDASAIVLARITGVVGAESESDIELPGWGELRGYGAAKRKTNVEVTTTTEGDQVIVQCDVKHDLQLLVPIGNYVAYEFGQVFLPIGEDKGYGAPHLTLTGTCTLVRPWSTENEIGEPGQAEPE